MKICPDCSAEYTDWVVRCTDCGATLIANENTEDEQVAYDLSSWSLPALSLVSELMAERDLPHEWRANELFIDPEIEEEVDALLADVETELGEQGTGVAPEGAAGEIVYDLADWDDEQRATLNVRLEESSVPFRWESDSLVIAEADEGLCEALLDEVEYGETEDPDAEDPDGETVDRLFLAAGRLSSDPGDSHGLENLSAVLPQVNATRPPFGFNRVAWRQIALTTDRLAGLLTDEDEPDGEAASAVARELTVLLQPFV